MEKIQVCEPLLVGNEMKYAMEAIETGWISSSGKFVNLFEESFANYCGAKYGIAVCNGTVALHLALVAMGVGKGDEVIIPNFTMTASAFSVCYTGAMPVFVDAKEDTWNIDPEKIEEKITPRTKAIMAVSIFGQPCEMDSIRLIAEKHNLKIIEDAAESHGAEYKGKKSGNLAEITTFSFFANKVLTTGEGGMVVTNDEHLWRQCQYYRNMCFSLDGNRNYKHEDIGFNYRMSNVAAAIGVAQVEKADFYKKQRIIHGEMYKEHLSKIGGITTQAVHEDTKSVYWMNSILADKDKYGRTKEELMGYLEEEGIETRLLFVGMNRQQSLLKYGCDGSGSYPVTDILTRDGLYLPSGSGLEIEQIERICDLIKRFKK